MQLFFTCIVSDNFCIVSDLDTWEKGRNFEVEIINYRLTTKNKIIMDKKKSIESLQFFVTHLAE